MHLSLLFAEMIMWLSRSLCAGAAGVTAVSQPQTPWLRFAWDHLEFGVWIYRAGSWQRGDRRALPRVWEFCPWVQHLLLVFVVSRKTDLFIFFLLFQWGVCDLTTKYPVGLGLLPRAFPRSEINLLPDLF